MEFDIRTNVEHYCKIRTNNISNIGKAMLENMCQAIISNKLTGLQPATLLNRDLGMGISCQCCKI